MFLLKGREKSKNEKQRDDLNNPEKIFEIHNAKGIWSCFCQICTEHFKMSDSRKNT